jgi:hypothetical protein
MSSIASESETDISSLDGFSSERSGNRTISGTIRALFRGAVKAITRREAGEPPPPRRRGGETGKAFGMAARAVLHRAARIPADAYMAATAYLTDTLDWLRLWDDNAGDAEELDNEFHCPDTDTHPLQL